MATDPTADREVAPNFITQRIDRDLDAGRYDKVVTRFPPEPNGYLHIGHATAICLDFGVANDYGGETNLRFDDTNPTTEDPSFVEAIERDVAWLGFTWARKRYASDYFETLYDLAVRLIERGDAYVDDRSLEEIRETRGTVTTPGVASAARDRSVEENLDLFQRMRAGEFADGSHVLRAKINLASPNMIMRDPVLYRIRRAHHYRTGDAWPIYPLYDFAHPLSDALEGVTHSLCTLEFENNREIYDWLVGRLFDTPRPQQIEFARLNLEHTVVSKRQLLRLVQDGHVSGWDDPRMPTLAALRRRGIRPSALRSFARQVGITKTNASTPVELLDAAVRDDLNDVAPRVMAVLDPVELRFARSAPPAERDAPLWPHDVPREGERPLAMGERLWVERGDVAQDAPKGWKRLAPGAIVRLRHGPVVRCIQVDVTDGQVQGVTVETVDEGREKVQGVIHWVDQASGVPAEFHLVNRLFRDAQPDLSQPLGELLNPDSLEVRHGFVEPYAAKQGQDTRFQFERQGYFWRDPNAADGENVFIRIVTLKDGWQKRSRQAPTKKAEPKATKSPRESDFIDRTPERIASLSPEERERFTALKQQGLEDGDAVRLAVEPKWTDFVAAAVADGVPATLAANWLLNELPRVQDGRSVSDLALDASTFTGLLRLLHEDRMTAAAARRLLGTLVDEPQDPEALMLQEGLEKMGDEDAVKQWVDEVLAAYPDRVEAFKAGKTGLRGFFVGQVMKRSQGRADAQRVGELVDQALNV
jgi:glutaminyl-tRNA synthetase